MRAPAMKDGNEPGEQWLGIRLILRPKSGYDENGDQAGRVPGRGFLLWLRHHPAIKNPGYEVWADLYLRRLLDRWPHSGRKDQRTKLDWRSGPDRCLPTLVLG